MLGWSLVAYAAVVAGLFLLVDVVRPALRDPEYALRAAALRERLAEHPGRPLVVVVGSSRAAMGVRPAAWEDARPGTAADPLVFNASRVGAGPLLQLMTLRRLYADGFRPAVVLLEYWPPLLHQRGPFVEAHRVETERLRLDDRAFVRDYLPNPDRTGRAVLAHRLNPLYTDRTRWLQRVAPSWLPGRRVEVGCRGLDGWGWLPGFDDARPDPVARADRVNHCQGVYRGHLRDLAVDPAADRAVREAVAVARGHGSRVALLYLPESTEFRGWYPPDAEQLARAHLDGLCRELRLPLIDARTWMPDAAIADGFHLTRGGAAAFTPRLVAVLCDLSR